MDYRQYRLKWKEKIKCLAVSLAFAGMISWLLYRSWFGIFSVAIIYPIYVEQKRREELEKKKYELLLGFKDAMQSVSAALMAGYSLENAWREGQREMDELYGETSCISTELRKINAAVKMNEPLEQKLMDFAKRSNCEDIWSFAEVFTFAKRSGGDFGKIIRTTIHKINGKIEVEREIATVISGKKMEQRVMNFVPAFILCYMNLTSEEFLEPLYGNLLGVVIMSSAFVVYLAAILLAKKIVDIRV